MSGPDWPVIASGAVLLAMLGRLAWIDLRSRRLPDVLTLPLVAAGLALAAAGIGPAPLDAAIGAAAGYAVFRAIGGAYFAARGIDGLGLGDAKLVAAAGAWLGWQALPALVLGASLPALAVAVLRADRGQIAFGPWLCASFAALWVWRALVA